MNEPVRVLAMNLRAFGDDSRRSPDAGFQAEPANLPSQPLHAVGKPVVSLPVAKGAVEAVIDLHVFEAERLKVAGGEFRLPQHLGLANRAEEREPTTPAVDRWIEPDLMHVADGLGIGFQGGEGIRGEIKHQTLRGDARAGL